ncbi:hypothetical protein IFT69_14380 [Pseudomonas putida]|nr:hypothetical protein [Pseudomonas putida]
MNLLITPRTDLPQSVIDRLTLIKTVFMELHPEMVEASLTTMLNRALEPKFRGTSSRELAHEMFHGLPVVKEQHKATSFTPSANKLTRAHQAKPDVAHEAVMSLCVAALLEDGLHPLATLSGFHLNSAQADELRNYDEDRIRDFDLLDWGVDFEATSPLLQPAIVILDSPEHSVLFDQKSIAEHHRRFAPLLSNKRDPLHACWEMTFAPKVDKLERNGPKVTRLTKAMGAITETYPELASDRVKNSDWAHIARHLWAVAGYVAELGQIHNLGLFLDETLKHPAQIEASTIIFLARNEKHPLKELMIERYAQHALSLGKVHENQNLLLAAAHCPDLGKRVGIGYEEIIHQAFSKHIASLDLETLDYALAPICKAWGRGLPSQDVRLIGTKICRHAQWREAVKEQLPATIEQYHQQFETFPEALREGQISPTSIPDHLVRPFAHQQMQRVISNETAQYLISLKHQGKIDARFIIEGLTTRGRFKNNSRLAKAYHQGVVTLQEISTIHPSGLDRVLQADLGM